jgi:hypothetical protein
VCRPVGLTATQRIRFEQQIKTTFPKEPGGYLMTRIGHPLEQPEIVIEPIEDPVPRTQPVKAPEPEITPDHEPDLVPA